MTAFLRRSIVATDRPIVGVLGGMGPAATADFFARLVAATPAQVDQDHLRVLVWSDSQIPDRSAALLGRGPDPTPRLVQGAELLVAGGAELIAVPCNTAHAFVDEIARRVDVEIVHMIKQTADHLAAITPSVNRVGMLATTGTVKARIYDPWLTDRGIDLVMPSGVEQKVIEAAIRAVKAGSRPEQIVQAVVGVSHSLVARGAQALVFGCTEVAPLLRGRDLAVPVVDTIDVLVDAIHRASTIGRPSFRREERSGGNDR